mgnify:CR=1 FL=1
MLYTRVLDIGKVQRKYKHLSVLHPYIHFADVCVLYVVGYPGKVYVHDTCNVHGSCRHTFPVYFITYVGNIRKNRVINLRGTAYWYLSLT